MGYKSNAIVSQGFKMEVGNSDSPLTFTEVKEITSFQGFDGQASKIDVTHMQSTAKEFRMGLQELGSFKFDVNYLSGDAGQSILRAAKGTGDEQEFKCTFSDGSTTTFAAYVSSAPRSGGVDAKIDGSFSLEINGDITDSPAP